jgi:hypothetical protein
LDAADDEILRVRAGRLSGSKVWCLVCKFEFLGLVIFGLRRRLSLSVSSVVGILNIKSDCLVFLRVTTIAMFSYI